MVIILSNIASATNYYVATWGNNSNDGLTVLTPKADFSQTDWFNAANVQAGDVIYLINGTWRNISIQFQYCFCNGQNIYPPKGNATNPIIITTYNGTATMIGNTSIDGIDMNGETFVNIAGDIKFSGYQYGILIGSSSNINISNITTVTTSNDGIIIRTNSSYITVDNVTVVNSSNHGILVFGYPYNTSYNSNVIIKNSIINVTHHNGIDIHTNNVNILLENNTIYNVTNSYGILLHNYNVSNVIVRNNTLLNNWRGIFASGTNNSIIENNSINLSTKDYGMGIFNVLDTAPSNNITFLNNMVINSAVYDINLYTDLACCSFPITNITFINTTINKPIRIYGNSATINNIIFRDIQSNQFSVVIDNSTISNSIVEFADNKIFNENSPSISGWYPGISKWSISNITGTYVLTEYPMTARPTSNPATITVNQFNTLLPSGQILINMTVNTTNGNNVVFNISDLSPGKSYIIKKSGNSFVTRQANSDGIINFNNSEWSMNTFTIEESPQPTGNISGKISYVNLTSLPGATVSLFYLDGTPYGVTASSGADGKFQFNNIDIGSYYVSVTKAKGYAPNQSSVFTVIANSTINIGTLPLMDYDINGDGKIDVLDLNFIGQHFGESTSKPYPVYDVNGDGVVNDSDLDIVAQHLSEGY